MPYSFKEIEKRLTFLWYKIVRQNWSHVLFSNWEKVFPVPKHSNKNISNWVESKIIKIIWLSKEDFKQLIKNKSKK